MPDEVDQAQEVIEATLQRAVDAARRPATETVSRFDCLDCAEPIPTARRVAIPGCQRCIDCQQLHENWRPL